MLENIMSQLVITIDRPYYRCLEPLEFAMAMAAFDHDVTVEIKGDAVELLSEQLPPLPFSGKDLNKLMKSLPLYDIDVVQTGSSDSNTSPNPAIQNSHTHIVFD